LTVPPPEPAERVGSLAPFFYCLGILTGVAFVELEAHPAFAWSIIPFFILADCGIYGFFLWLFQEDMVLQFRNRVKKLRGTVGFKWQPTRKMRFP
jgi:hypothetical protein